MTPDLVTPAAYNSAATNGWTSSDEIDLIAPAFVAALGQLEDVPRGRLADAGKYQYRFADLADVLATSRPTLAAHGLAVFQVPVTDHDSVVVRTTLLHTSGQWLRFDPLRLPAGGTAQNVGSAITYARRYSLLASLGLATEDDDGADAGTPEAELLPQATVEQFRKNVRRDGLDAGDVAAIVLAATSGRTDDVEAVWSTELDVLRATYAEWIADDQSAAAPDAPAVDAAADADDEDTKSNGG